MPSDLTVAEARLTVGEVADPSGNYPQLFLPLLNRACNAIFQQGQWNGLLGEVNFDATTGFITLPRRWESVVADVFAERGAAPVYGRYHEFSLFGPQFFNNIEWKLNHLTDVGYYPTQIYQESALPIQISIASASDAGVTIRLYGVDANGDVIYDSTGAEGVAYTTAYPTVTTAESFLLTGVTKPETVSAVTVSSVDGATILPLSTYEPTETNPLYRRYKCGTYPARTDDQPVIRTLCKRRFISLVNETDPVYPSNLRALRLAMSACKLEADGSYELGTSLPYWQQCYNELNANLRQVRGAIRSPGAFVYGISAGATRVTN